MQHYSREKGFGFVGVLVVIIVLAVIGSVGAYVYHRDHRAKASTSNSTTSKTPQTNTTGNAGNTAPKTHTPQEAVDFAQKTYDDYLAAVNAANNASTHRQPVAQVGLAAVKDSLTPGLYTQAAAVTQATPFSCTAQYVADKYVTSLLSSDGANAIVAVSISNGSALHTDGMRVTVDLATLKITSVTCPN